MLIRWEKVWLKATVWLASEIILNFLGLDHFADYSEFIWDQEVIVVTRQQTTTAVIPLHPSSRN